MIRIRLWTITTILFCFVCGIGMLAFSVDKALGCTEVDYKDNYDFASICSIGAGS